MYHSRIVLSVGGSVWYMIRNLCCTVTIDSVLANFKTQNAFLFTVNAIFRHDYPLAVEPGSTPRPLVQKKTWRDSLPIDMLLSAVSILVVAQSSSEILEGLMNNPVYHLSSNPTTPVIKKRLKSRGNFHLMLQQRRLESNNNPWTHPRYYLSSYVTPWLHSMSCLVRSNQRSGRDSNYRVSEYDGCTSEWTFLYHYSSSFELQAVRMWRIPIQHAPSTKPQHRITNRHCLQWGGGGGKPVQITRARQWGRGPDYVVYVFASHDNTIICWRHKLTFSDHSSPHSATECRSF